MTTDSERTNAVEDALGRIRSRVEQGGITRDVLCGVLSEVKGLARQSQLWMDAKFPAPSSDERQARYLIREDNNHQYALYLNVMRPGKRIPPHNHTTWVCVAGVVGEEHNTLYRRLDDGGKPGRAHIARAGERAVGPGTGIALLGEDIHSVEIRGDQIIRHLHLYGQALETLNDRLIFNEEEGTCRVMDVGVKTRR